MKQKKKGIEAHCLCVCVCIAFFKPKFRENSKESKLDFVFVSFPYKLNCLDFCCYFFSELMSIFFILFLLRYFVCEDIERNKL